VGFGIITGKLRPFAKNAQGVPVMAANYHTRSNEPSTSQAILLTTFLICLLVCGAARSDDASLRDAWLQAPKPEAANWDRKAALERLLASVKLEGMTRAKVLGILGQPGYSQEDYPGPTTFDVYLLSAANRQSYRINYDSGKKVVSDGIEGAPCTCHVCATDAPLISAAVLDKSGLLRAPSWQNPHTMSAVENILGGPGRVLLSHSMAGQRAWLNYTETWRMGGAPHEFLAVGGHVGVTDAPRDAISNQRAEEWDLITFMPGCLAK
jgi:hypothetical protein